MTNPIEPVRRPVAERLLPIVSARPTRALMRRLNAVAAWARLSNGPLRLGAADVVTPLDPQTRALLWYVLTETVSAIAVLARRRSAAHRGAGGNWNPRRAGARAGCDGGAATRLARRGRRAAAHLCRGNPDPRFAAVSRSLAVARRCMASIRPASWRLAAAGSSTAAILRAPATASSSAVGNSAWRWGYRAWRELLPERPVAAPVLIAADDLA